MFSLKGNAIIFLIYINNSNIYYSKTIYFCYLIYLYNTITTFVQILYFGSHFEGNIEFFVSFLIGFIIWLINQIYFSTIFWYFDWYDALIKCILMRAPDKIIKESIELFWGSKLQISNKLAGLSLFIIILAEIKQINTKTQSKYGIPAPWQQFQQQKHFIWLIEAC